MSTGKHLRTRLAKPEILNTPGIYDALSALLAEKAGFEAVFLSGSSVAYSQLGRPDIGLVTMTEMADACTRITERVNIPVLVDVDSGFGNAAHATRTIRVMERAGAAGVQIEDQLPVKQANDLKARPLVEIATMVDKIKALTDERTSDDMLISARSDAPASEPIEKCVERVERYREAGADLVFSEGLTKAEDVSKIVQAADGTPVVYNLLHAGREISSSAQLEALGVSVALYPGNGVLAAANALSKAFNELSENLALPDNGFDLSPKGLNDLLDAPELIARYKDYA